MTDADRHWRYALAAMLIVSTVALGFAVIFHAIPTDSQRIVDALFGGLLPITGNAVSKAIDAGRSLADAATIKGQSEQLGAASPPQPEGPVGTPSDPVSVVQEPTPSRTETPTE